MRIRLNKDLCVGHGRCYAVAPGVFDADDRGHCALLHPDVVPAELEAQARSGVANCPEDAIELAE